MISESELWWGEPRRCAEGR